VYHFYLENVNGNCEFDIFLGSFVSQFGMEEGDYGYLPLTIFVIYYVLKFWAYPV